MSKQPAYWNKAKKYLSSKDRIMRNLIIKYSDANLTSRKDVFFSLCKSIIGQQISVAAANSVFLKFKKKFKNNNPKLIKKMNDEEAINYLSNLKQIGRWSAEMILLFTYNRSNIWPVQDIGLLRAISKNYKKNIYHQKSLLIYSRKDIRLIVQSQLGIYGEVLTLSLFSTKSFDN